MLVTIIKEFKNDSTDYRTQYLANRKLTYLSNWINSFLEDYDRALYKLNHPTLKKTFREELPNNFLRDFVVHEYQISGCSLILTESTNSKWINNGRCFQSGKLEINILSDNPSQLNNITKRINSAIYQFENPPACPTCGINTDDC
jgi:hypothetical protein